MSAVTILVRSPDPMLVAAVNEIVRSIGGLTLQVVSSEEILGCSGHKEVALVLFHVSNSGDGAAAATLVRTLQPSHRGRRPRLVVSDGDNPELELRSAATRGR